MCAKNWQASSRHGRPTQRPMLWSSFCALLLLLSPSTNFAAQLELHSDAAGFGSVSFRGGPANEELTAVIGSADGLNVSSKAYGEDFITSSGTSLDVTGRRLDALEQSSSCTSLITAQASLLTSQASEIAALRADVATLLRHFNYLPPSAPPPPAPPLVPTAYSCSVYYSGFMLGGPYSQVGSTADPGACWQLILENRASGGSCIDTPYFNLEAFHRGGGCLCFTGTSSGLSRGNYQAYGPCEVVAGTG